MLSNLVLYLFFASATSAQLPYAQLSITHCFDMPMKDFCIVERIEKKSVTIIVRQEDLGSLGELPWKFPDARWEDNWIYDQIQFNLEPTDRFQDYASKAVGGFNHDFSKGGFPGMDSPSPIPKPKPFGFQGPIDPGQRDLPKLKTETQGACDSKCHHGVLSEMIITGSQFFTVGAAGGWKAGVEYAQQGGVSPFVGGMSGAVIGGLIGATTGVIAGYEKGMAEYSTPDLPPKTESQPTANEPTPPPPSNNDQTKTPNPESAVANVKIGFPVIKKNSPMPIKIDLSGLKTPPPIRINIDPRDPPDMPIGGI